MSNGSSEPIPTPNSVTTDQFKKFSDQHKQTISQLEVRIKQIDFFLVGIVFVFFFALAGLFMAVNVLFIDHVRSKENSYQDLIRTINRQEEKVDLLSQKISDDGRSQKKR